MFFRRVSAVLLLGLMLCAGIFADDGTPVYVLPGDMLNSRLKKYVRNISRLIPDSVTTQNMWSYAPKNTKGMFGYGFNASFTMSKLSERRELRSSAVGFGGADIDLFNFPETIPYFPAFAVDVRGGWKYFDVGLTGMWASSDVTEGLSDIVNGSFYAHRTIGLDVRVALLCDGVAGFFKMPLKLNKKYIPGLTVQAGYYFTWMTLGFPANMNTNEINMDFRNDAYFFTAQVSKTFIDLLTPFVGLKLIISSTVSEFNWSSLQKVSFGETVYEPGAKYTSGTDTRETYSYLHLYGGLGVKYSVYDFTLGLSYNLVSSHFAVSLAARMIW